MKTILINDEKCMACHSCEIACCVAHSEARTLYGALAEAPLLASRLHVEQGGKGRGFPLGCRHCQDPHCVKACVTKALYKSPDGMVLLDERRCIGCLMCFMACPFGSIEQGSSLQEVYHISKCDLCVQIDEDPACVGACPTGALSFEDPDAFSKSKRAQYLVELATMPEAVA